ncbi:hypothetical protein BD410DRAFT_616716 [Rickenella mellea]|uniref:Uncharacterized protein n=1 Tax=Rickenella mellea TaxID=50990 RepID=A0A4Y7PMH6_9AGAM|nr:hypothetical protein BD410DRAFT_616716 [Rickenella mellea]
MVSASASQTHTSLPTTTVTPTTRHTMHAHMSPRKPPPPLRLRIRNLYQSLSCTSRASQFSIDSGNTLPPHAPPMLSYETFASPPLLQLGLPHLRTLLPMTIRFCSLRRYTMSHRTRQYAPLNSSQLCTIMPSNSPSQL